MARKKCKECLGCFQVFWVEGKRYYYCWFCKIFYEGRDDDLHQCEDPRLKLNVPVEIKEQNDNTDNANNF